MKITFGGHDLLLHPSGALYWPEEKLLVVSDMHLEKGSHFALKGFFLPPYDSHRTLSLLSDVIRMINPARLLLLGDAFHDAKGYARMGAKELGLFEKLRTVDPIWIRGNHDGDFVPDGFLGMEEYSLRGLTFRHEPIQGGAQEISGHLHPKVEIGRSGRPCFIENGSKMIMPAFGAYTGGLFVTHKAIAAHMGANSRIYALGNEKVYAIPSKVV